MNFPDNLLPAAWLLPGWILFALALAWVVRGAPWIRLKDTAQLNIWLGTCVVLMALWSIEGGIRPGLNFHLVGATAMTLMFGPQLALVGLSIVLAAVTLAGMSGWEVFGWNGLYMALLPVAASYGLFRLADRRLPNLLFVYIFFNACLGAVISICLTGLAATLLLHLSGVYLATYLYHNYLPYFILLGWSEAVATGMALTLMLVYRPHWVGTFDEERYIHNK